MKKFILIPARLSSKRLPNKVLLDLKGKTILQRVYEQCNQVKDVKVFITTDSKKVEESCLKFTQNIIMTSVNHKSGTERIIEAVENLDYDLLINVQGDEPFINPLLIESLFKLLEHKKDFVVTVCEQLSSFEDLFDPNTVKVVKDINHNALYFSRSAIPHVRDVAELPKDEDKFFENTCFYKHVGIYGYNKTFIKKYSSLAISPLEEQEVLEQLRILENGFKIKVLETEYKSLGIDTKDDYEKALELIHESS